MSVRFKEEQEAQTTSDETTYEYSDGVITVKTWKGEPLDSLPKGRRKLVNRGSVVYGTKINLVGVKSENDLVVIWVYEKNSGTNYIIEYIKSLIHGESMGFINVLDSLFFLPPEAARAAGRLGKAIEVASEKGFRSLSDLKYVFGDVVGQVATALKHIYGQLYGKVPAIYFLPGRIWYNIQNVSCANIFILQSDLDFTDVGVVQTRKGTWLWSYCFGDREFPIIVARDESELLDFLIGSEDGSRVARDIADALRQHIARSRIECEVGQRVLGRIKMFFG